MLLGYTGIVSFAHTMFFAIGAYGVAIPLARGWVGWDAVLAGTLAGVALSVVVAALHRAAVACGCSGSSSP